MGEHLGRKFCMRRVDSDKVPQAAPKVVYMKQCKQGTVW